MKQAKKKTAKRKRANPVKREPTWQSIADQLGVSSPRLHQLRRQPESPEGKDVEAWKAYMQEREAVAAKGSGRVVVAGKKYTAADIIDLRAKLTAEQGRGEELKNRIREFDLRVKEAGLVPMAEAKAAIHKALSPIASEIERLPKSCAIKANPSDPALAEGAIADAVQSVLKSIKRTRKQADEST